MRFLLTATAITRTSMLKNKVSAYETLVSGYEDALTLIEMGDEEEDLSILPDAQQEVEKFRKELEEQRLSFSGTGRLRQGLNYLDVCSASRV